MSNATNLAANELNNPNNNFQLYPNPMQNQFTIAIKTTTDADYSITDITGKIILSGLLEDGLTTVDSNGLRAGVYLVRIADGNTTTIKKIIKN